MECKSENNMCTLTTSIHSGNINAIHAQSAITINNASPQVNPRNEIQRGKIAVRKAMPHVENMNTAAILRAKVLMNACDARRTNS